MMDDLEATILKQKIIIEMLQESMNSLSNMIRETVPAMLPRQSSENLAKLLADSIARNPFMRPVDVMLNQSNDESSK